MNPSPAKTYHLSCTVDPYRDGWLLARFLSERFRYHPPHLWDERLAAGVVRVNGTVAAGDTPVRKGDTVQYEIVHAEPEVDFRYDVLHEDADVLAVGKSGNLPVHAGGKFIENTLIARLRDDFGTTDLTLAHRLDRETSGVVLLARNRAAARGLQMQFEERGVEKQYVAVVRGILEDTVVDAPIARREPAAPPYFRVVDSDRGRASVTAFRHLAHGESRAPDSDDLPLSLVEARPESGRTNQIRVHAAHLGHPILGDKIYGIPEALAREFVDAGPTEAIDRAAGAPRHLLHCLRLRLIHPATGAPLEVSAPLPEDLRSAASWSPPLGDRFGPA
ncbi:MAG: RluA family pseudouridine synthase [Gemmatimonadetes bacterium]|nr:RluA family pseudouridine synthase [Gemmatimonadota bacterium]